MEQAQTLVESDFPYAGIHVAEASGQVSADAAEESTGLLDAALVTDTVMLVHYASSSTV